MAASNFTFLHVAAFKIGEGAYDFASDAFAMVLCTDTEALTASFTGTSGQGRYSDLSHEVSNGDGYTTGGEALTGVSYTTSAGTAKFDADDVTWTALTKTFKYAVLVNTTSANDDIIGFWDLSSGGGSINIVGTDYNLIFDANGIWTLTHNP